MDKITLGTRNVSIEFPGVKALSNVDFEIHTGMIHAVMGANGAGKSTLMKVLAGSNPDYTGDVLYNGNVVELRNPAAAKKLGIQIVYQEVDMALVPTLSVAENVMFNDMVMNMGHKQFVNYGKIRKDAKEALARLNIDIDVRRWCGTLTLAQKQMVLIARAVQNSCNFLILDEPTAVLTPQETEKLFRVLRKMRDDGKAIVIITHKMHEVESLSDRVAVLRSGQYIGCMKTKDTNVTEMTNMMVGHTVTLNIDRPDPVNPKPRIEVEGLTVRNEEGVVKLQDVSFTANSGEILGIAGISGCGQKELLEAIAGLQVTEAGTIAYVEDDGSREMLIGMDPKKIAELGVSLSFVPEDRLGMGLVGNMDLADNMMLRSFRQGHSPFTDRKQPRQLANDVVESLEVVTPGISTPVRRLSGGNVQKVLVGREIASAPTVLLTAYAVRGLDINSSYTIYDLLNQQKKKGVAVIFVGEDLDVLLELSDRILVLCGGQVSGIVDARTTDKNTVGMMMTKVGGEKNHEGEE